MRKLLLIFLLVTLTVAADDSLSGSYFSEIEKWQQQNQQKYADFGDLLIFVSFTMPPASLQQLIADAHLVGGRLVIRGLVNNSFKDTTQALYTLIRESKQGGLMLDPMLFKKFKIIQVPAFVVADHSNLSQPICSKYDVVYGNVALEYALHKIASAGDEREIAQRMLEILTVR